MDRKSQQNIVQTASEVARFEVLFKLKQDQEDLGDEHVLGSVSSSLTASEAERVDSVASHRGLDLILHVCAERITPCESDSEGEILMAMEEGRDETG